MEYQVIAKKGQQYLWLAGEGTLIESEQDALDLVAACMQENTNLLMISAGRLSENFGRLATGVAGAAAQKWSQYHIKTALVMDSQDAKGKFKEFLLETNRGGALRSYSTAEEAEGWLLEGCGDDCQGKTGEQKHRRY